MTDKQLITEQIVKVQNELERLNNLLQDEPEESNSHVTDFDCIAVTQVQVFPFKDCVDAKFKGLANVVLNDQLLLRGLRINDGANGLWVGFPVDPFFNGEEFRTLVVPMTKQLREHIENCVLEKYQAAIE